MSLINWGNNNNTLDTIERRMTNMMENFWDSARHGRLSERFDTGGINPAVEITENDKAFIVHAELPGVHKEDIHVNVNDNSLTFSGESKHSTQTSNDNVRYSERRYGSFSRTIPVPDNVDKDQIEANFKDGVLDLSMPKTKSSTSKRITVN